MTANTPENSELKIGLVDDVMTLINVEGILKGDEEVVGGFDLIYKGKEIMLPNTSIYSSMLGCKTNRVENLKKLTRNCAYRLSKEYMEKEQAKQKAQNNTTQPNKFNLKKPKSISNPNQAPVVGGSVKKKIDNVNQDFIKIIEDRKGGQLSSKREEE